jgi:8-oxo-dGTP pyrophosphatase MutT (NUDIX family)
VPEPRTFTPAQRSILQELLAHAPATDAEAVDARRIARFAASTPSPMDRDRREGHVVGSGLVVARDGSGVLLARHRTLERWLQFGGHAEEGESHPLDVALRETREESGLDHVVPADPAHPLLDVDVHTIPASEGMPAHEHLDLRYLLVADPDADLDRADAELAAVEWLGWEAALDRSGEPGLERMLRKAREAVG